MLYVQLDPWATLLKEGKAVAILRAAGRVQGESRGGSGMQCWRKAGVFANHDVTRPVIFVPCIASVPAFEWVSV